MELRGQKKDHFPECLSLPTLGITNVLSLAFARDILSKGFSPDPLKSCGDQVSPGEKFIVSFTFLTVGLLHCMSRVTFLLFGPDLKIRKSKYKIQGSLCMLSLLRRAGLV